MRDNHPDGMSPHLFASFELHSRSMILLTPRPDDRSAGGAEGEAPKKRKAPVGKGRGKGAASKKVKLENEVDVKDEDEAEI